MSASLSFPHSLSFYLSIYLSIYLFLSLSTFFTSLTSSDDLSIYILICCYFYLSLFLSKIFFCTSHSLLFHRCTHHIISTYLLVLISFCLIIMANTVRCLSICQSFYLSVFLTLSLDIIFLSFTTLPFLLSKCISNKYTAAAEQTSITRKCLSFIFRGRAMGVFISGFFLSIFSIF